MSKLIFLLISLFSLQALAQVDRTCLDEMNLGDEFRLDPFFQPMRMMQGPFKGECVDNRQRRHIKILTDAAQLSQYGIEKKSGHIYFANFMYKSKYYIAEYPENSIAQTLLVFEKFYEVGGKPETDVQKAVTRLVLSGHIQLRFIMKEGTSLNLYPQVAAAGTSPVALTDFAYSLYAVRPLSIFNEKFEPLGRGIKDGYIFATNFLSTYDVALIYRDVLASGEQVSQFILEDSHFDAELALKALLEQSNNYFHGHQLTYHTWKRNCVSSTFTGIDAGAHSLSLKGWVEGIGWGAVRWSKTFGTDGVEWNPLAVLPNLERRGLIKGRRESETTSFNREACSILEPQDLGSLAERCANR